MSHHHHHQHHYSPTPPPLISDESGIIQCDSCAVKNHLESSISQLREASQNCAECLKLSGNQKFLTNQLDEAVRLFTRAININPQKWELYSNRSAAFLRKSRFQEAYQDAVNSLSIEKNFRGYGRKGSAQIGLSLFREAAQSFIQALQLNASDEGSFESLLHLLKERLVELRQKQSHNTAESYSLVACQLCFGLLFEPSTLSCGHTFCKGCLGTASYRQCLTCAASIDSSEGRTINITLCDFMKNHFNLQKQHSICSLIQSCQPKPAFALLQEIQNENPTFYLYQSAKLNLQEKNYTRAYEQVNKLLQSDGLPSLSRALHLKLLIAEHIRDPLELQKTLFQYLLTTSWFDTDVALLRRFLSTLVWDHCANVQLDALWDVNVQSPPRNSGATKRVKKEEVQKCDPAEFQCSLCYDLIFEPVTLTCGHSFCRCCLVRALAHQDQCPLCRYMLPQVTTSNRKTDRTMEQLVSSLFSNEYQERQRSLLQEETLQEDEIPLFVCALLFPGQSLPLYIFEPRYKLMLRRCMESGSRKFGILAPKLKPHESPNFFAMIGCVAEIQSEPFMLEDGRAFVNTRGGQRFRVLSTKERDGYLVGKVEYFADEDLPMAPVGSDNETKKRDGPEDGPSSDDDGPQDLGGSGGLSPSRSSDTSVLPSSSPSQSGSSSSSSSNSSSSSSNNNNNNNTNTNNSDDFNTNANNSNDHSSGRTEQLVALKASVNKNPVKPTTCQLLMQGILTKTHVSAEDVPSEPTTFSFFFSEIISQSSPTFGYLFLCSRSTEDRLKLISQLICGQ